MIWAGVSGIVCAVLASLLTAVLWALSAVFGTRSAKIMGGTAANYWRLLFATVVLGAWAHLFGYGVRGPSFFLFFVSGIVGIGGDVFLFQSYPRIGSRLTVLILQCFSAVSGALIDWLWHGTVLTGIQIAACVTILTGVVVALAPGEHLNVTRRVLITGIVLSALGGLANGIGAVLSGAAYKVAANAKVNMDPVTASYQRLLGGLVVAGICTVAVRWHRGRLPEATFADGSSPTERRRHGMPWVVANSLAGQVLGMTTYQWALKTTPPGLVLAVIATSPLVVIPFSQAMEGEKMTRRSVIGGVVAVIGAVVLVRTRVGK